jgi:hypothetical protein
MVKFGQTRPPAQALATSPFAQDAIKKDAPEAMLKSEGRTIMAEPLWTILQNNAAKVGDHKVTQCKIVTRSCSKRAEKRTRSVTLKIHNLANMGLNIFYCHLWQSHFSDHLHRLDSVNRWMRLLKHPRQEMSFNPWLRILFHPR